MGNPSGLSTCNIECMRALSMILSHSGVECSRSSFVNKDEWRIPLLSGDPFSGIHHHCMNMTGIEHNQLVVESKGLNWKL